jgi:hypothetical protein
VSAYSSTYDPTRAIGLVTRLRPVKTRHGGRENVAASEAVDDQPASRAQHLAGTPATHQIALSNVDCQQGRDTRGVQSSTSSDTLRHSGRISQRLPPSQVRSRPIASSSASSNTRVIPSPGTLPA